MPMQAFGDPSVKRTCVLAFGTVGDVRPLAALALRLHQSGHQLTFVTHRAHQVRTMLLITSERGTSSEPSQLDPLSPGTSVPQDWLGLPLQAAGIAVRWIDSLPARRWHAAEAGKRRREEDGGGGGAAGTAGEAGSWVDEEAHRESCIAACEAALGLQLPAAGLDAPRASAAGSAVPAARTASAGGLVVFNLFALEGFHIAEALGVPCAAASPCLVPYAAPAAFERAFRRAHPQLFEALQAADECQRQQEEDGEQCLRRSLGKVCAMLGAGC